MIRQPETFAKPTTNGTSATRRHFDKSVTLCLIRYFAVNCHIFVLDFRLLLGFCKGFSLKTFLRAELGWFKRADFVHFGRVVAVRIVAQIEPDVHQCPCGRGGDDVLPHAQDLRVVVFYCAAHAG